MSDVDDMLEDYFGEEEEPQERWEALYDKLPGGDIFTIAQLFGDTTPDLLEPIFEPRTMTMTELVEAKYDGTHSEEEISRIERSIGVLTDRIYQEEKRYKSYDVDYLQTVNIGKYLKGDTK